MSETLIKVITMLETFISNIITLSYSMLFYEVTLFNKTFELWQILSVVGIGTIITILIIKIFR